MDTRIFSKKMIMSMRSHLEKNSFKFITYPKFVFLCGMALDASQYDKSNRGIVDRFLKGSVPDVHIVLSEKLWEDGFIPNIDLLTFEEFLAEISDCIILFVESPGSFCELGVFSYANKLFSDKLVVVVDTQYRNQKSFIMTGPVSKVRRDGSQVVYASLGGTGLLASKELRDALIKRISMFDSRSALLNKRAVNTDSNCVFINSFIVEMLEIIRISQPIKRSDLIDLYKAIKGFSAFRFVKRNGDDFHAEIKFDYIIKLLHGVGIIKIEDSRITLSEYEKTQSLMFKYHGKAEDAERNRMICRKYRYGGNIT